MARTWTSGGFQHAGEAFEGHVVLTPVASCPLCTAGRLQWGTQAKPHRSLVNVPMNKLVCSPNQSFLCKSSSQPRFSSRCYLWRPQCTPQLRPWQLWTERNFVAQKLWHKTCGTAFMHTCHSFSEAQICWRVSTQTARLARKARVTMSDSRCLSWCLQVAVYPYVPAAVRLCVFISCACTSTDGLEWWF